MNFSTIYFLIFALIHVHLVVEAERSNEPAIVEDAEGDDDKAIQESSLSNKTNEAVGIEEDTSKQAVPKKYQIPSNRKLKLKQLCKSKKSKAHSAAESAAAAKLKNIKQAIALNLPSELNYPNIFGTLPTDVNSPGQPDQSLEEIELGYQGDLYDIFQKRLNRVFRELYNNVNAQPVTSSPAQTMSYDVEKPAKRSALSNCLYEEFKRRLDKFNKEFLEPSKAIKRTSNAKEGGNNQNAAAKRSSAKENMYEQYKRRLDKLGKEQWFDGSAKVFDRIDHDATPAGLLLIATPQRNEQQKSKCSGGGGAKAIEQGDFYYEEFKKKLDQMTRELYEKSNQRITRKYTDLTEEDLASPALQRLVTAVQLDGAKAAMGKAEMRDGSSSFEGSNMLLKIDKAIDRFDEKQDSKRSLGDGNALGKNIFGDDSLSFMTGVSQTGAVSPLTSAATSYPAVLIKSIDTNLGMLGNATPNNLLATVATKMNMTTLDLAKKLATMSNPLGYVAKTDPQLGEEMQKIIELAISNAPSSTQAIKNAAVNEVSIVSGLPLLGPDKSGVPKPLMMQDVPFGGAVPSLVSGRAASTAAASAHFSPTTEPPCDPATTQPQTVTAAPSIAAPATPSVQQQHDAEAARIAGVLDKVLGKLELIQSCKANGVESAAEACQSEGAPCDVVGSWNSHKMGLRFDISLSKAADRRLAAAEKNNKLLTIELGERTPPHAHHIIDTSWKFMGSALNQYGGPFYIYSQNRDLGIVTTFIGYCRVCGDIDTIFGSWTIMGPSKDCEDVTTAIENKRDVMRRYNMENKRNKHFKDMLFEKSKYAKPECEKG